MVAHPHIEVAANTLHNGRLFCRTPCLCTVAPAPDRTTRRLPSLLAVADLPDMSL